MVWYSPLLREDSLTPFPRRSGRSLTSAKVAHRRQRRNHVLVAAPATGRTQPGQACGGMDSETDAPILIPPERPRSPTRPSQSEYRGDDTNGVPIASSCPRCLLQVIAAAPNHRPRLRALAFVRGPRAPVTNSPTSTDTASAAVRGGAAAPSASPSTQSPAISRIQQKFPGTLAGPAEAASAGAGNDCGPVVVGGRDATKAPTVYYRSHTSLASLCPKAPVPWCQRHQSPRPGPCNCVWPRRDRNTHKCCRPLACQYFSTLGAQQHGI